MLKVNEIKEKEKEIYSEISKCVKQFTGKGPVNTEAFIHERFVMVRMTGHILTIEQQQASTLQGFIQAKINRCTWFDTLEPILSKRVSELIGHEVLESFHDADPQNNVSIMVFFYN